MVFSADDEPGRPSDRLIALALDAAEHARKVSFAELNQRIGAPPYFTEVWPGEHYRLLAGLVLALNPKFILEIGTGDGLSALAMKSVLRADGAIATFDIINWQNNPRTVLQSGDFEDGRLVQYQDDLSNPLMLPIYLEQFRNADLIFVDAPKDGVFEEKLLKNLDSIPFASKPIVVLDDIRLWNMLRLWREISRPKLDVTSFGHWSGTGFVEWGSNT